MKMKKILLILAMAGLMGRATVTTNEDVTGVFLGGGGVTVGGSDTQVQYNNAGALGGAPLYVGASRNLQVDQGTGVSGFLQFLQGSTTGSATTDGFRMGYFSGGTNQFELKYQESSSIAFKYGSVAYLLTGGSDVSLCDPGNSGNCLISSNKGLKISTGVISKPTCDSSARGNVWYIEGSTGVVDTFEACRKDSNDVYAWTSMIPNLGSQTVNAQTGTSYTTVWADLGKLVTLSNASAIALTVPTNASVPYPVGSRIDFFQLGAGQVTFAGDTGVTVNGAIGLKARAQYSPISIIKTGTNAWVLIGDAAT